MKTEPAMILFNMKNITSSTMVEQNDDFIVIDSCKSFSVSS